jgi:hypothetical protein
MRLMFNTRVYIDILHTNLHKIQWQCTNVMNLCLSSKHFFFPIKTANQSSYCLICSILSAFLLRMTIVMCHQTHAYSYCQYFSIQNCIYRNPGWGGLKHTMLRDFKKKTLINTKLKCSHYLKVKCTNAHV